MAGLAVAESETDSTTDFELTGAQIRARRWQLLTVSVVVIAIDQATKIWAVNTLPDNTIDGPFGSALRLVYNRGSAFSLGEGLGPLFGVLAIAISIAMFFLVKQIGPRFVVFGMGLIQGGAIGNVIDRLFRDGDGFMGGAVIDFLEVGDWWPVFNIADSAIVVGAIIVALLSPRE